MKTENELKTEEDRFLREQTNGNFSQLPTSTQEAIHKYLVSDERNKINLIFSAVAAASAALLFSEGQSIEVSGAIVCAAAYYGFKNQSVNIEALIRESCLNEKNASLFTRFAYKTFDAFGYSLSDYSPKKVLFGDEKAVVAQEKEGVSVSFFKRASIALKDVMSGKSFDSYVEERLRPIAEMHHGKIGDSTRMIFENKKEETQKKDVPTSASLSSAAPR